LERILTTEGLMEDAVILMINIYANHLIQLVRNNAHYFAIQNLFKLLYFIEPV